MEAIKIIILSVVAACVYGVANDLVTAHLCIEFFNIFPIDVYSGNPVVVAVVFGVMTTWWVGLILGLLVAASSRLGHFYRFSMVEMIRPIAKFLLTVGLVATVFGFVGYGIAPSALEDKAIQEIFSVIPNEKLRMAFAVNSAHQGGYLAAFFGGIGLCIFTLSKRVKNSAPEIHKCSPYEGRLRKIFVSYRRSDAAHVADRIFGRLAEYFGNQRVFKDVESIPLGVDFRKHIEKTLESADVFLCIIGPGWTGSDKEQCAIENEQDFVRLETQIALERRIPIIPVFVGGATMPEKDRLPSAIKGVAEMNGTPVRSAPDFENDVQRLISGILYYDQKKPIG